MDPNVVFVTPDKFVLKEASREIVTISYNARNQEPYYQLNKLCTVCFFYGDEVSRQQFRRAVLFKPEMAQKVIAEFSKLKNTRFDEEFPGEQLVCEVYDLPQRPNDIQLFYGNMHKIVLSVVGCTDINLARTSVQPSLGTGLGRAAENTQRSISNTSLDDLPVKGPQGSHLSNVDIPLRNGNRSENTLIVQPE
ncbi:unnamed protein product, partial [Staurois parvus]